MNEGDIPMEQKTKRVHTIDGIRGFSLLGILFANLLIFQYGLWGKDEIELLHLSVVDEWLYAGTKIGVESSFLPIFTFLFGYSMMMMRDSLERKQLRIKWHFFRRSLLLIGIGLLHGIFLWEGDILLLYGMMGIFLLFFLNRKKKTILIWGMSLFLLFGLSMLVPDDGEALYNQGEMNDYVIETTDVYGTGTYNEIKTYRNTAEDPMFSSMGDGEMLLLMLMTPLVIAPMFLFGMYAAKRKWFFRPEKERKGYLVVTVLGISVGLGMKVYGFITSNLTYLDFAGMILAFGYIGLFGLWYSSGVMRKVLYCLENVGKLSLTNYMMQTVICTFIFYGYGFGQFGKMGIGWAMILGLMIFGMQMAFSALYMEKFRYGPLEKLLRMGTYLKWSKSREKAKHEAA